MRDMIYERLIELSSAQESLILAGELMDKLCQSQQMIEKHSYEAMNMTDTVLNLARKGRQLVAAIMDGGCTYSENPCEEKKENLVHLLDEMNLLLNEIMDAAAKDNEILHSIESIASDQCGMTNELQHTISTVNHCVDHAVACAELVMTKDVFE